MSAMSGAERQRRYRERYVTDSREILLKILAELQSLRDIVTKSHVTETPNGFPKERFPPAPPSKEITLPLPPITHFVRESSKSSDFDRWWDGYPDKVGKGSARKAFAKALTKTSIDQLIAGVERYKATKPLDRPWCNPATWLNQERWLDAPANASQPAANGHSPEINEMRAKQLAELARKGIHVLPGSMT